MRRYGAIGWGFDSGVDKSMTPLLDTRGQAFPGAAGLLRNVKPPKNTGVSAFNLLYEAAAPSCLVTGAYLQAALSHQRDAATGRFFR